MFSINSTTGFTNSDTYSCITGKHIGTSSTSNIKSALSITTNLAPDVNNSTLNTLYVYPNITTYNIITSYTALNIDSGTSTSNITTSYGLYVKTPSFGTTAICTRLDGPVGINMNPGIVSGSTLYSLDISSDNARKATTSTWATGSDMRIKNNIQEADYDICYNNIKNLALKRFTWNDTLLPDLLDRTSIGWIAQEVEQIYPKAVTKSEGYGLEDFRTLNSDQINKCLYGCVKKLITKIEQDENLLTKQQEQISTQQEQISTQQEQINNLISLVNKLMNN
jgi:hypothetical protein